MPFKYNPFTGQFDYYETGTQGPPGPPASFGLYYPNVIKADTPKSYWELAEPGYLKNTVRKDEMVAGITLLNRGDSTFAPKRGFDNNWAAKQGSPQAGVDAYPFTVNAPFTLELWVYPPTGMGTGTEIVAESGGWAIYTGFAGPLIGFGRNVGPAGTAIAFGAFDAWNYVTFVYDGTNRLFYMNGASIASVPDGGSNTDNGHLLSMLAAAAGGSDSELWVQHFAIYDYALSGAQIAAHYAARFSGPTDSLPGDKGDPGTSVDVARLDHIHEREVAVSAQSIARTLLLMGS